jgi:3-oxoacyl-[acyl-carrier protein] reductase
MDLGLKGKKAIVTGGSRGIGRTVCELLAEEGCDLALCARGRAGVEEAVTALVGKSVRAHGGVVDVADTNALRTWIVDAVGQLGGLDIFVANVSAFGMAMDEDTWRRSFEIDVMGTVAGVEAAIPHLEKSVLART